MTVAEYNVLMEAYSLRRVDRERDLHYLAFLTFAATATTKSGSPIYRDFKKFFDYEKEVARVKRGLNSKPKGDIRDKVKAVGELLYGRR